MKNIKLNTFDGQSDNKKEKKPPYIHHCAVFVDDFKKASKTLKDFGLEEILYAETSSGFPFAMHDARKVSGHLLEIYEPNQELTNFYRMVEESSRNEDKE